MLRKPLSMSGSREWGWSAARLLGEANGEASIGEKGERCPTPKDQLKFKFQGEPNSH